MGRATVIFADGSKQMAHNLDDSRFRWYERKSYHLEDVKQSHSKGIPIRDCSSPSNLEQAHGWRAELVTIKGAISEAKYIMDLESSKPSREGLYLRIAFTEVDKQLRILNDFIKHQTITLANREDELGSKAYKQKLRAENEELKSQVIFLQRVLLEQFGIDFATVDNPQS